MRSRYSAFAVADTAYLLRTWHPTTRPATIVLDPEQRWLRLVVLAAHRGGLLDAEGTVEFRATYELHGQPGSMSERSRFVRVTGKWLYEGPG